MNEVFPYAVWNREWKILRNDWQLPLIINVNHIDMSARMEYKDVIYKFRVPLASDCVLRAGEYVANEQLTEIDCRGLLAKLRKLNGSPMKPRGSLSHSAQIWISLFNWIVGNSTSSWTLFRNIIKYLQFWMNFYSAPYNRKTTRF